MKLVVWQSLIKQLWTDYNMQPGITILERGVKGRQVEHRKSPCFNISFPRTRPITSLGWPVWTSDYSVILICIRIYCKLCSIDSSSPTALLLLQMWPSDPWTYRSARGGQGCYWCWRSWGEYGLKREIWEWDRLGVQGPGSTEHQCV